MVPISVRGGRRPYVGAVVLAHPEIAGLTDWRPLARGGFATVWEARQETLNRLVAVKVDQRTLDDAKERRRFLREAGAAGRMSGHPGIVTVHDASILPDGRPYLVMELCPGGSLTTWLKDEARPTQEQVRDVGITIADALAAAHSHGVLHRDVKPANIMIDAYGHPGLADFGLAAMPAPGQDLSVTMEALTPAYAPKEVLYQRPPSEYGDVYSLAATLYALLDGKPPRWPDSGTPSLPEIFELQGKPIERLPGVNAQLMDVLMNALADEVTERQSAAEFRDQLRAVDFSAPVKPPPRPVVPPAPDRGEGRRRNRVPLLIALVAVLVVGAVAAGMALAGMQTPSAGPTAPVSATDLPTTLAPSTPASSSSAPTQTPRPTDPAPPEGFVDCSDLLGVQNAFCPTAPECWYQYGSLNNFPAVANPVVCDDLHQHETFVAGQIKFRVRLQSQLDNDPSVKRLCQLAVARKVVQGTSVEGDWGVVAYPPQDGEAQGLFRCLVSTGENRSSPLKLRTFR